jgi:hypothetical protein
MSWTLERLRGEEILSTPSLGITDLNAYLYGKECPECLSTPSLGITFVASVAQEGANEAAFNSLSRDHIISNASCEKLLWDILSTPSLGITRIVKTLLRLRPPFNSLSRDHLFVPAQTHKTQGDTFQLPLSGSLGITRIIPFRTPPPPTTFNSLSRDHHIVPHLKSPRYFAFFQLPLSGSRLLLSPSECT